MCICHECEHSVIMAGGGALLPTALLHCTCLPEHIGSVSLLRSVILSHTCMPANRGSPSSCGSRSSPSAQLKSCVALGVLPVPLPTSLPAASAGPEPPLCPLPAHCTSVQLERSKSLGPCRVSSSLSYAEHVNSTN